MDKDKAKALAGIRARSAKRYGKSLGKAAVLATYNRYHPGKSAKAPGQQKKVAGEQSARNFTPRQLGKPATVDPGASRIKPLGKPMAKALGKPTTITRKPKG